MARPFEKLPPGSRAHLEAMAEAGTLTESKASTALGLPTEQFRKVIRNHKPSRDLWNDCLSIERDRLLEMLWSKAEEGDRQAAQWLLAARHGITDKSPALEESRVNVVINLPAALDSAGYGKLIEQEKVKQLNADKTD